MAVAANENRWSHLLEPIRDLAQNWSIDIAAEASQGNTASRIASTVSRFHHPCTARLTGPQSKLLRQNNCAQYHNTDSVHAATNCLQQRSG
eukprot:6202609-Pleurochrysis_carterae.AAC.3